MAQPKEDDPSQICDMAIDEVVKRMDIKFPQYPELGNKFREHCKNEAFEDLDVLITDVAEGYDESVILDAVYSDIEIKDEDKEPICISIHYTLTNYSPPPISLNLGQIYVYINIVSIC